MADQLRAKKRAKAESYDPEDLVIFGVDIPAPADHPLVDRDLKRLARIEEPLVKNMTVLGVLLPIVVLSVQLPSRPWDGCGALVELPWWQQLAARGAVRERDLWGQRVTALVDGRRRTIHGRLANLVRRERGEEPWLIRSVARRGSDTDASHQDAAISANRYHAGHNAIAEARQIAARRNAGASWDHCEDVFGLSVSSMENRLALLDLAPLVQAALEDGRIGAMAALSLREFEMQQQEALLVRALAEGGPKRGLVPRIGVLAVELGMRSPKLAPADHAEQADATETPSTESALCGACGWPDVDVPSDGGMQGHVDPDSAEISEGDDEGDSWPTNVLDALGTPIRRNDWVEVSEPGEAVYRGQVVAASPEDVGHLLTVMHLIGMRYGQHWTRQRLSSSAFARAILNPPDDATADEQFAYSKPGASLADARAARAPAPENVTPDEQPARVEASTSATAESEAEPAKVSHKVLDRVLRHPLARKLLTPENILTFEWLVGRGSPPRRVAAALEAVNAPLPAEFKNATAGRTKKRAIRQAR